MHRVVFLDNLRYLMVLLVVVLHAAISYGNFVPWWCVKDTSSVFFDVLLLALDSFLMPVLYFIAGYFAISSFQKNGVRLLSNLAWCLCFSFLVDHLVFKVIVAFHNCNSGNHFFRFATKYNHE